MALLMALRVFFKRTSINKQAKVPNDFCKS